MKDPQVIICDNKGNLTGEYMPREAAHTGAGKRHLAITVLLYNSKGEVLLQRRKHKIFDDVWDYGATHPLHLDDYDESFEGSTKRCLEREYGIARGSVKLKNLGTFNYFSNYINNLCENEHCALLIGEYNGALLLNNEVGYGYKWISKEDFWSDINNNPQDYSPWAIAALPLLLKASFFGERNQEVEEVISIVDECNKIIGRAKRGEVYKKGLLHRAVNVVIKNPQGQIFLQRRSASKKSFPLHWDLSCAEHLKPGETYNEAAIRGLQEELGIVTKVKKIRPVHLQKSEFKKGKELVKEYELVETYQGTWNEEIMLDHTEVSDGKFFSVDEIEKMVNSDTAKFTPWFLDEWYFLIAGRED